MSGMGCYVLIEVALRDRVPQERPVTILEIYARALITAATHAVAV